MIQGLTLAAGVLLALSAGWYVTRFPLTALICAIVGTVLIGRGLG